MKKTLLLIAAVLTAATVEAKVHPAEEPAVPQTGVLSLSKGKTIQKVQLKEPGANSFFEGFEDFDGSRGWIPSGWKDVSKKGHSTPKDEYENDLTWHGRVADYYTAPFEGESFMLIKADAAYGGHDVEEQDEWLIAPDIYVAEGNIMYFMLSYSPYAVRYNSSTGLYDAVNSLLEVQISSDGGDTWNKEWDVMEDASKYTDDELLNDLIDGFNSPRPYIPVYINLDKYAGKTVKMALRYTGLGGSDMCVDNFTIGLPSPKSCYELPAGIFMSALAKNTDMPKNPTLMIPSAEITWNNTSSYANTYEWTYEDASGESVRSSDYNLLTPVYMSNATVPTPKLNASYNGGNGVDYQSPFTQMSVNMLSEMENTEGVMARFGAGNYDWTDPTASFKFSRTIGFDENTCTVWSNFFGCPEWFYTPTAIANVYERPLRPYALSQVYASAKIDALHPDAELTLTVYEYLDEYETLGNVLATGVCKADDITDVEGSYSCLTFDIEGGTHIISCPVVVEIGGFDLAGDAVYFPFLLSTDNNKPGYSYMRIHDNTDDYDVYYPLCNVPGFSEGAHVAGCLIALDTAHMWLYSENGDYTFNSNADGGMKTFNIDFSDGVDWDTEVSDNWISASRVDFEDTPQESMLVINTQALPQGVKYREGTVTMSDGGCLSRVFTVTQDAMSGVLTVSDALQTQTSVVAGGICVTNAAGASSAAVYDAVGRCAGTCSVHDGTVIPAGKGVHIIRFDNGTTIKVAI